MSIEFTNTGDKYCWVARAPFEIDAPITISCWVYMKSFPGGADRGIYSMGGNSGILCVQRNDDKVGMYVREKTPIQWQFCLSTNALSTNQWYHFCQVITATDMHFYIDTVDQVAINPGGYGGDINYPDAVEFLIGSYSGNESDTTMEDFAYWNKELTTAQILLLAKSYKKRMPLQIETGNLMLYHPFDEANIGANFPTARDMSGNGRDATMVNNPTGAEGILSYPSSIKHI